MQMRKPLLALLLAMTAGTAAVADAYPPYGSEIRPANRIVGMWQAHVSIGPCNGGPVRQFLGLNVYNAGGTLNDANTFPPTSRGPGMGVWTYVGHAPSGGHLFRSRFQFARFKADGSFDGLQDVKQDITVQPAGNALTSTIAADVLNPDGSLRAQLCGTAIADRVTLD